MNRIYRLVWGQALNAWVVVAETSRGRGKGSSPKLIAAALLLNAAFAQAAPVGGQVVTGTGNITQSGATTTINQASQNLSLNWQSFNIAPSETVNFVQPSASAIAVNRIFDTNGTQILGKINANGQVYLINPNGILFGQGAQVNVGGLVASTLDFNDASLNGSSRTFSASGVSGSGSIINQGTIHATGSGGTGGSGGYVALLGNTVSNQGTITAPLGTVALGAGSATTLTFQNNSLVKMQVDQSVLNSLAENGGLIRADGGLVVLSAGAKNALLASVVNNTGVIEARTLANHAGSIILLGGMTAGTTYVSGTLDASAPNGGNGGFIETSAAHVKIANDAKITTAAPAGKTGTWLIDPVDFTIAASSGDITGAALGGLLASNSITIQTATSPTATSTNLIGTAGSNGDIHVNDAVSWSANTTLTLNAFRNININRSMTATGASGKLALLYGQGSTDGVIGGVTSAYNVNAPVDLSAGLNFSTQLGSTGNVKDYTVITNLGAAADATGGAATLQGMAATANLATNYALGSNINAADTATWNSNSAIPPIYAGFTPIGNFTNNFTNNFTGTFDGLGHTISNLTINRPGTDYVGLFGRTGAGSVIQNVGLVGGSVSGLMFVGGLVGENSGTISNSYATGSVSGSNGGAGGLVAYNSGTISNSYATGSVSGRGYLGGLVGVNGNATISNSYATGSVSGPVDLIGGLAGYNFGTISNSYATGSVSGGDHVGGLVGRNTHGTISTSYATGSVSGVNSVGGLAGYTGGGTISTSYATGSVSGLSYVGGLVGYTGGSAISNNYWNTSDNISGRWGVGNDQTNSNVTGLTSAQMLQKSNFAGFDFTVTPVWGGNAAINSGYPILCAFGACITTTSVYAVPLTGFSLYGSTPVFTYGLVDVNGSAFTLSNASMGGTATNSSGAPTAFSNAGSYSFSYLSGLGLTGTGASNYVLAPYSASVVWRVDKAPLTITANSDTSKTYTGLSQSVSGFTASGLVNNQTAGVNGVLSGVSASGAGTNAGSYNVVASGTDSNYNLTLNNGALSIGKANASVIGMVATSRDYNGTDIAALSGGTVSGTVNGETLSFSGQSGRFDTPNVGRGKVVTVSGLTLVNGSGLAGNYNLLQQSGLSADINAPATALNAMAQLSGVLSNRVNNEPQTLNLSPTPTVTQSVGTESAASASESGNPAAGGTRTTVNTIVINIGATGTTLQIVNGGMRLPNTMANQNSERRTP